MEILNKIIELTELLNKASVMYYTYDNPIMDDLKYDLLYKELEELELKYPEYKQSNSPTNRVGSSVLSIFKKVKHDKKMMSLKDAFNYDDLISFDDKIKKICSDYSYICELKIDGLSCSLKYENGKLTSNCKKREKIYNI